MKNQAYSVCTRVYGPVWTGGARRGGPSRSRRPKPPPAAARMRSRGTEGARRQLTQPSRPTGRLKTPGAAQSCGRGRGDERGLAWQQGRGRTRVRTTGMRARGRGTCSRWGFCGRVCQARVTGSKEGPFYLQEPFQECLFRKRQHDRLRSTCKECGGSQLCEHDRRRSTCKECLVVGHLPPQAPKELVPGMRGIADMRA